MNINRLSKILGVMGCACAVTDTGLNHKANYITYNGARHFTITHDDCLNLRDCYYRSSSPKQIVYHITPKILNALLLIRPQEDELIKFLEEWKEHEN